MNPCFCRLVALGALVLGTGACSAASPGKAGPGADAGTDAGGGDAGTPAYEQARQAMLNIVAMDPRLAMQTPLTPDDYQALAQSFAGVPGVQAASYTGDLLGTIYIQIQNGGIIVYRHITNDYAEATMLPPQADFSTMLDPKYNAGFLPPVAAPTTVPHHPVPGTDPLMNKWATHFPVALANPDPTYASDGAVTCPMEGKIAIVDFLWTSAHRDYPGLYNSQFMVDMVMLYDRITQMGKAGNFTVDVYKDTDINLINYTVLQGYDLVFTVGHGYRPGPETVMAIPSASTMALTAEIYDPTKLTFWNATQLDAWSKGYIAFTLDNETVLWSTTMIRDFYKAAVPQLVMLGECNALLMFADPGLKQDPMTKTWSWTQGTTQPIYSFGHAFRDAGAQVVFGYVSPATPEAIVMNSMPFFRRMFGAYSVNDVPPSPLHYWPTCMGVQTFFRLPTSPGQAIYADKNEGSSMFTMFGADSPNLLLRKVCPGPVPDALMQDFMLKVGTPATAFQNCWNAWWSQGMYPTPVQDPLCTLGDNPTTQALANDAACGVKIARQVTNAMLTTM
jgi:hypothetical protein